MNDDLLLLSTAAGMVEV